ncbi:hypothetical protein CPTMiller_00148 [Citrobacter phage Miller]|uniref:Uncharacterized protein n=1 Tax=Citrobacter phage Miller TaxID=1527524 RepID=A0A076YMS7_9CAUD|nr:hypothetical protein CPTMiller_00148 [Citrobacter phage Miller]AIK68084.1 hypothetical protein CPTMiller_00148 [Citrobacter phage Miller]
MSIGLQFALLIGAVILMGLVIGIGYKMGNKE